MFLRTANIVVVVLGAIGCLSPEMHADEVRVIRGWGLVVDPAQDCRFTETAGSLAITVPGAYRDLVAFAAQKNTEAPRVVQSAEGDFTLHVTARKFELPRPKSAASDQNPTSYVGGGLLVWQNADAFLRLQRAANGDSKSGPAPFLHANQFAEGKMIANVILRQEVDQDMQLRIERRAGKIALAYGYDGRTWTAVEMIGAPQPIAGPVQVGTFVINATNRPITHEFADFRLSK